MIIEKIYNAEYLTRLDNIIQWQDKNVVKRESVSQHSYKVVLFTRLFLQDLFEGCNDRIHQDIIILSVDYAMFHDWDEALIFRDLSHDFKYNEFNGEEVRRVVDRYVEYISEKEFGVDSFICKNLKSEAILIKKIVKFADWLALNHFIKNEINKQILEKEKKKCEENAIRTFNEILEILKNSKINFNIVNITEWKITQLFQ